MDCHLFYRREFTRGDRGVFKDSMLFLGDCVVVYSAKTRGGGRSRTRSQRREKAQIPVHDQPLTPVKAGHSGVCVSRGVTESVGQLGVQWYTMSVIVNSMSVASQEETC